MSNSPIIKQPKGDKGDKGDTGDTGPQGPQGEQGVPGEDGLGVPAGGLTDQVLTKASDADNDTIWADSGGVGLPPGGTAGQYIEKNSATDGDASWVEPIIGLTGGNLEVVAALPGTPDANTIYFVAP